MTTLKQVVEQAWSYDRIEKAYMNGTINDVTYVAALWLWRNAAFRYSTLAARYEGTPPPSEECAALFEKMKQGLC